MQMFVPLKTPAVYLNQMTHIKNSIIAEPENQLYFR